MRSVPIYIIGLAKEVDVEHKMEAQYRQLPTYEGKAPPKNWLHMPKLSRFKLLGILFVIILSIIFIALTCYTTGLFQKSPVCFPTQTIGSDIDSNDTENSRIRYKHTKRRLPGCIIIGVRKGGTRALLNYINMHPSVQAAGDEIHFFDDDENYNWGYEWYRRQMPYSFKGQITMEKTPAYFTDEETPSRVYKMNSSMKMILVVRNPVERLVSDYAQIAENKRVRNKKMPAFEELVIDKNTGEINRSYAGVRRSVYYRHMARWLEYFPLTHFLVVDGEKLIEDPVKEVSKVESFLELEHRISKKNFVFNRQKGFYCMRMGEHDKCLVASKGRKHPDVDPEIIEKLKEFFKLKNLKFFKQIGKTFEW